MIEGHGDDAYRYKETIIADFSSNVFYGGLDKGLKIHLQGEIETVTHYPESDAWHLQIAAAKAYGVEPFQVLVTNGVTEAIYLVAQEYKKHARTAVVAGPTFVEYRDACSMHGIKIIFTDWKDIKEENYKLNGLFFICNPNNPNGEAMPVERLLRLFAKNPRTLFVVDESYIEFTLATESLIPHLVRYANVLVLRSLTKSCRIPGLRVGFVVGHPATILLFRNGKMPWSVNQLAIAAGLYIFKHRQQFTVPVRHLLAATSIWQEQLQKAFNWRVCGTDTHFFLIETPQEFTAAALKEHLVSGYGLLIRDAANFGLNPRFFRVACQSPEHNQFLTEALSQCARTGLS